MSDQAPEKKTEIDNDRLRAVIRVELETCDDPLARAWLLRLVERASVTVPSSPAQAKAA